MSTVGWLWLADLVARSLAATVTAMSIRARLVAFTAVLRLAALVCFAVVAAGCSIISDSVDSTDASSPDAMAETAADDDPAESAAARTDSDDADDTNVQATQARPDPSGVDSWPLVLAAAGSAEAPDPDTTLLPLDPDVRIGRLDNGLTYYVRRNDSPGSAVSLRLAVNAGSLQQEVHNSGLAHFVEHMMFNGTETWPGNTLLDALQDIGAEIGPDFNAFTSENETVYLLDLPTNDPDEVSVGFRILAEWAEKATMQEDDVIAERGVVREEVRLRDEGPTAGIDARFDLAYFSGTPYEGADPGGLGELVLDTTRSDAVRFYDRWYRPDNMAIVAVGDLPADDLENEIIEIFSDLADRSDQQARTTTPLDLIDEPIVDVLIEPAAGTSFISIDWTVPVWDRGTVGGERLDLIQDLIGAMMQTRLSEQVARGEAELFDPFVGHIGVNRDRALLGLNTSSPDLASGVTTVLGEFAIAAADGFSADELNRAAQDVVASIDQFNASRSTLQDSWFADQYWSHFLTGTSMSSVPETVDRIRNLAQDVTVDEVDAHFRWIMQSAAPIVIVVGETADEVPTRDELVQAIEDAADLAFTSGDRSAFDVVEVDRLVDPGAAGEVLDRRSVDGIDRPTTLLTFAHGARVIFSESGIDAGRVTLQARAEGGWSALDPADALVAHVALNAATRSGLGSVDSLSLDRYLRTSEAWLAPYLTETAEGFSGGSSADDVEDLFALLHLRSTAPAVEGPALAQAKEDARDFQRDARTDPATALSLEVSRLRYANDPRHIGLVDDEALEGLDAERAVDIYTERFVGVDDLVIALAGDLSLDTVIELSEQYIATIPAKPADTWLDASPPLAAGVTSSELVIGPPGSAGAVSMLFSAPSTWDRRTQVEVDLLDQMLNQRLFETVREELAVTYGGWIVLQHVPDPDSTVESQVLIQGDPDRLDDIRDAILEQISELSIGGPTADEFDRAVNVLESDYGFITNNDLIDQALAVVNLDQGPFGTNERFELLRAVSRRDVQELAATLLPLDQRIEVLRFPES